MTNFSPQHPKVQAWSQLRARIRSAWNDLFYSDRPENDDPVSGFTLRKLFAGVWAIAAIAFTAREDLTTIFSVGVPLAMLGYVYLSGLRLGCFLQGVFWSWLVLGWYCCYKYPYDIAPVSLPASAHHIRTSGNWNHVQYRFEAPVADCIKTAEKYLAKARYPVLSNDAEIIDRSVGKRVPDDGKYMSSRASWMDLHNINKGLYYRANYNEEIWIDTEREIFYFRWHD